MEQNKTFVIEEALKELENINTRLSSEDITLADSIALYKTGTELAVKCKQHLMEVGKQIEDLDQKNVGDSNIPSYFQ